MTNNKANEEISKFKLLSAYGGPGSIIHSEYGSVLISSIEEWGFIQKVQGFIAEAATTKEDERERVQRESTLQHIKISNDERLLAELRDRKELANLSYLVLMPDIEIDDFFRTIKTRDKVRLAINSTFMPKGFFNRFNHYKEYKEWYRKWQESHEISNFFPPKEGAYELKQDNIVLICENGHISDFPWARYLSFKFDNPNPVHQAVNLFDQATCCNAPDIRIIDTSATASGFDTKWLSCKNEGCRCQGGTSLKGIMSLKVTCPGHKPWEVATGDPGAYFGNSDARRKSPLAEPCSANHMRVTLTTANNIYYSRTLSSLFMPHELFLSQVQFEIKKLQDELEEAKQRNEFELCVELSNRIKGLQQSEPAEAAGELNDTERDLLYRYQEFNALTSKTDEQINVSADLKVKNVTSNLGSQLTDFFSCVLRIDNLKLTSAQLDFSRVEPIDSVADSRRAKNIFRSNRDNVRVYPVVENFGEGILFAFSSDRILQHTTDAQRFRALFDRPRSKFAANAVQLARTRDWPLYLIHTFSHLIMRELEFRCGYPTASLSERLYVSNQQETQMYGCMIYTSEGAEGSMGGLIAQTREGNLNDLILSALKRATICNSDPLCWESEGQGLFDLNLASCFFCSLVSETSCEQRNIYLDRRQLVDDAFGFFKDVLS